MFLLLFLWVIVNSPIHIIAIFNIKCVLFIIGERIRLKHLQQERQHLNANDSDANNTIYKREGKLS